MGDFKVVTLPPPINGLDKVSAINQLDPLSAQDLENVYPDDGKVAVRLGFTAYYDTSAGNPAKTLTSLKLSDGTEKIIFTANTHVYELDSGVRTSLGSGATQDAWQSVTYNYLLFLVNGADTPFYYNGTSLAALTFTGVTLSSLINVNTYKERLYFVEKDSGSIWYGGTKSISGALTELNLEYVMRYGGYIVACGGFANASANQQAEDLFYALSSEGEIFFYSGSYPGDAEWQLIARYKIGKPLGYRCCIDVENDTLLLTDRGIVSCSNLLSGTPTTALDTLGRRINKIIRECAQEVPYSYLWTGLYWSAGGRLFIQLPESSSSSVNQYLVCNLNIPSYCTYSFNPGDTSYGYWHSLGLFEGHPYAGSSDGKIAKLEDGYSDNGNEIVYDLLYGYSDFGSQQFKRFIEIRPLLKTASGVEMDISIKTDYRQVVQSATITTTGTYTAWGSPWGSPWSSSVETKYDRYALSASGHTGALHVEGSIIDVPLEFYSFEIAFEDGALR